MPTPITEVIDFLVENHCSIFLLRPLTEASDEWVREFLPENAQTFGGRLAVEHRFISDIVRGISDAGLTVRI